MFKVLVSDKVDESGLKLLEEEGFYVERNFDITHDELLEKINDFDAIIVRSRTKVTKEVIENGKKLKVIGRAGVGLDNIDVEEAKKRGIKVVNSPEGPTRAVAELVIALAFNLFRGINKGDSALKEGKWIKKQLVGRELEGKTLGIIGLGRIGRKVAKIACALGLNVLGTDIIKIQCEYAKFVSLEEVLRNADIISIHVPLTDETRGLIGEKEFEQMKDGVVIINTSRGSIIDEKALYNALQSGKVAGAGLDVFSEEPPQSDFLLNLINHPNVIATPHIGANTKEALQKNSQIIARKIIETLKEQKQ